jgi:tRNA dimethylallyltransferase
VTAGGGARGRDEPILALVGPTGAGKTQAALALARELPLEVVSVDSRQVYRGMDIGTAKPSAAERAAVPHHLVDVADPDETYDAARFCREAAAAIDAIRSRDRLPVLVGGTGLYYRALVRGLALRPPADPEVRRQLRNEALREGPDALHARLAALDPAAAARLGARDVVRIIRALEVILLTGRPASVTEPGLWHESRGPYRVVGIGLTRSRPALYARLDARVDRMIADGLPDEVARLLAAGFGPDLPAMQGIGYRHLIPVVTRGAPLEEAVRAMKRDTRRYAKRQWTWFAREPDLRWVAVDGGLATVTAAVKNSLDMTRTLGYPEQAWRA